MLHSHFTAYLITSLPRADIRRVCAAIMDHCNGRPVGGKVRMTDDADNRADSRKDVDIRCC